MARKVVLDLTAIVTITLLDAWQWLDSGSEFIVSRATFDQIGEWLHETGTDSQPYAQSYLTDSGRIAYQPLTAEQLQRNRDTIQSMASRSKELMHGEE